VKGQVFVCGVKVRISNVGDQQNITAHSQEKMPNLRPQTHRTPAIQNEFTFFNDVPAAIPGESGQLKVSISGKTGQLQITTFSETGDLDLFILGVNRRQIASQFTKTGSL
jgi:hypothetical protein